MRQPVVFVGPCSSREQPLQRGFDLCCAVAFACHRINAGGEFTRTSGEVLGQIIEDLRPQVPSGLGPAFDGVCGLNRVTDVLAAASADVAQQVAFGAVDGFGIAAVGAGLFATDEHLGGAVDARRCRTFVVAFKGHNWFQRVQRACGFGVGHQALDATFAAKAAFAHAAEGGGGVEHIGAIDPDHACNQFRCDIEGKVHVLSPECRGQPVAGVVRQLDSLSRGAEGGGDQHRAKDLFLHQRISG